jgi:outer membrane protein assembly factor BamB
VNITVNLPLNGPIITREPQSLTLSNGNTAVLTVQATGNGILSYQWFKDGIAIAGATTNSLTLSNSQLSDSAMYTVQVSDSTGTNSSTRAPVSVLQPVTPIWVKPIGLSIFTAPAVGQGGLVYVGSDNYNLVSIEPNGAFQWRYQTTNYVRTSPAVDTNNSIYLGSDDSSVYCLNLDGTKRWSFKTGGLIGSGLALGADGTIYAGSYDHNLYALNSDGSHQRDHLFRLGRR